MSDVAQDGLLEARRLEDEGRRALCEHAARCGAEARARLGGFDASRIGALLADEFAVRFPTEVRFDPGFLEPGEFGAALPVGARPVDGYVLCVHPFFADRPDDLPWIVAYHLVTVNYGEAACAEAAEAFGAALCGTTADAFYARVCAIADAVPVCAPEAGCGGGCGCGG